jgi:conjugal transfer mating pair stabilization protein TraG
MSADVEIITYGGGDLLRQVFNAISMLFYGNENNSNFVQPLCVISALIGGAWGISRCFFQSYIEGLINKYFLPILVIPTLFMIPQATVHITDKINPKPLKVDHVPLLFAKIAGVTSFWGYEMTKAIDKVMHTPNDVQYCKTGMVFGSDAVLDFSKLRLNNATVAQNLHQFAQQCIIYDVALGRYSLDELRKSSDILLFLKDRTSKVRMIPYFNQTEKKQDLKETKKKEFVLREFVTCQDAINKMSSLFDGEAKYYLNHEILKNIPISYQTLFNFKKLSEDKINDQMHKATKTTDAVCKDIVVINAFDNAASCFATERAKDIQRTTYQTAGSFAGNSLVTLRIVFEALIYAICVFILPLSMLPGGIKYIGYWIFLNVWIQLWPPLYAILNYITMIAAHKYALSIQEGINGFSLFASAGFQDMAHDIAALGGYLSLSVPVISFYILQNLQSVAHLSGSLLAPSQSAVSTASTELSSGNYSFANSSFGQISYDNQNSFQHNLAPSLSSGFFTDNFGTHQMKYGQNHLTMNQDPSNLNTSISTAEAYSQQLQNAQQYAKSHLETAQNSYNESRGIAERSIADLVQHVSNSTAYSEGYNQTEIQAMQESANWIQNASESWGKQRGLSERESLEYFTGLGLGLLENKVGYSGNIGALSDEARQSAQNIFDSHDFQKHYQNVLNNSHNETVNSLSDEGKRLSENYTASMEKLKSSQMQLSAADSELHQISESLSYVQSNTNSITSNLNTEFANWLDEKGEMGVLTNPKRSFELQDLIHEFISEKCESDLGFSLSNYKDPNSFARSNVDNFDNDWQKIKTRVHQKAEESGIDAIDIQEKKQELSSNYELDKIKVSNALSKQHHDLNNSQQNLKQGFENEANKSALERLNARTVDNIRQGLEKSPNLVGCIKDYWFNSYAKPEEW